MGEGTACSLGTALSSTLTAKLIGLTAYMMGYTVVPISLVALKMCMLVYLLAEYFENVHNYVCFCVNVLLSYWFIYGYL